MSLVRIPARVFVAWTLPSDSDPPSAAWKEAIHQEILDECPKVIRDSWQNLWIEADENLHAREEHIRALLEEVVLRLDRERENQGLPAPITLDLENRAATQYRYQDDSCACLTSYPLALGGERWQVVDPGDDRRVARFVLQSEFLFQIG